MGKQGAHQEQNWTVKPVPLTPSCTAVPRGPSMGDLFSLGRGGRELLWFVSYLSALKIKIKHRFSLDGERRTSAQRLQ